MENSARIIYVDVLRGCAILLVVMGHLLESNYHQDSILYDFIYSFHMPLFFCISGYVTMISCRLNCQSRVKHYLTYLFKKFKSIIVPYLFWSLFVCPIFFVRSMGNINLVAIFKDTFIENGSYWFLPCLFNLLVIFTIWRFIEDRWVKNLIIQIVLLVFIMGGGISFVLK